MTVIIILHVIIGVALIYIIARLFVANRREEHKLAEKTRRQVKLMKRHFDLAERLNRNFPNLLNL